MQTRRLRYPRIALVVLDGTSLAVWLRIGMDMVRLKRADQGA